MNADLSLNLDIAVPEPRKRCSRCKEQLPLDAFHRLTAAKTGRQPYCKACQRLNRDEYEERNAEVLRLRHVERLARTPSPDETKQCRKCGAVKPLLDFYAHRGTKDRRANYCMECQKAASREWTRRNAEKVRARNAAARAAYPERNRARNREWRLRMFGLTPEQFDALLLAQGGVCAICGRTETAIDARTGNPRSLAVDHCHTTYQVRGLLCMSCNQALGAMRDDPAMLRAAIAYLERGSGGAGGSDG